MPDHNRETDAEARLRWHEDPENPFRLGDVGLAAVEEAIDEGWDEARPKNLSPQKMLELHRDPNHRLKLDDPEAVEELALQLSRPRAVRPTTR